MTDNTEDYSFDSSSFDNEDLGVDNVGDDVIYRFDDSNDFDDDEGDEPVTIVDDISSSLRVHKPQKYEFSGASEVVDGAVTVVHLDDEGNEHSQVIDLASPELSREEARELTKTIRTQTNVLYLLIARAHAGKAHIALGYSSFEAYIRAEFDYSKSYAYKLINQANIISAIEEVMPEGTQVYVSDATARGLKASMNSFIPELESRVSANPEEDPAAIMDELVQQYRENRDSTPDDSSELDDDDQFGEGGGDFNGNGGGGEYQGGGNGEYQGGGNEEGDFESDYDTENYDEEADEDAFDGEDGQTVRRRYEAVYNLYTALSQFSQMPSNDDIIKTIPPERRPQVTAYLETAVTWLQNFREEWVREIVEAEETNEFSEDDDNDSEHDEENESSNDEASDTEEHEYQ